MSNAKQPGVDIDLPDLRIASEKTQFIDRFADWASDWFSPILVKETRQALKSRQFFWTYLILLSAVVGWTIVGLTLTESSGNFVNAGPSVLMGYFAIVGIPLAIVIPFSTFRSLAVEFEDGTIDLVSVTTMRARQIVTGKLGSSLLQMLTYLSVMMPCIVFTYLLRGISIPQLVGTIAICVIGSFALCCIALFFSSVTKKRRSAVAVSVLLLILQIFSYISWLTVAGGIVSSELVFLTNSDGLFVLVGILMAMASTGMLTFAAATVQISFESDNRSTITRIMMQIQQFLFIGWSISAMCYSMEPITPIVLTWVTTHYWMLLGFIMVGENPQLSSRVRRSLPNSFWGRSLFAFFFPGPGRGLLFASANIWFCGIAFFVLYTVGYDWLPKTVSVSSNFSPGPRRYFSGVPEMSLYLTGSIAICMYSSVYLSLTYLIISALRKITKINGLVSFVMGIFIVIVVTVGALIYHFNFSAPRQTVDYSTSQILNMYWTVGAIISDNANPIHWFFLSFFGLFGIALTTVAMAKAAGELTIRKTITPERVTQDRIEERKIETPAKGESLDEIFGVLDQSSNGGDASDRNKD